MGYCDAIGRTQTLAGDVDGQDYPTTQTPDPNNPIPKKEHNHSWRAYRGADNSKFGC